MSMSNVIDSNNAASLNCYDDTSCMKTKQLTTYDNVYCHGLNSCKNLHLENDTNSKYDIYMACLNNVFITKSYCLFK